LRQLREQLAHDGESYDIEVSRVNDKLTIPVRIKLVSLDRVEN
jgi:hypothetical protein